MGTIANLLVKLQADLDGMEVMRMRGGQIFKDFSSSAADAFTVTRGEMRKLTNEATKLSDSLRTPIEKYRDELNKLNLMLDTGVLTQENFARAVTKTRRELNESSGMRAAGKRMLDESGFGAFAEIAGPAAAIFAIVESAEKLKEVVLNVTEGAEQTERLAQAFQTTAGNLSRLQGAVFLQSGMGKEQFNQMLEKMAQDLGDAAAQGGDVARAIGQLGLNVGQLTRMKPDQAFTQIVDSLSHIRNASEQAQVAEEIFGRGWRDLIPTLAGGAAGLEVAASKARSLGLAISDQDAAKLAQAADAIRELQAAAEGFGNELAIHVAPALSHFLEHISEMIERVSHLGDSRDKGYAIFSGLTGYHSQIRDFEIAVKETNALIDEARDIVARYNKDAALADKISDVQELIEKYKEERDVLKDVVALAQKDGPIEAGSPIDKTVKENAENLAQAQRVLERLQKKQAASPGGGTGGIADIQRLAEEATRMAEQFESPAEKLKGKLGDIYQMLQNNIIGFRDFVVFSGRAFEAAAKMPESVRKALDDMQHAATAMQELRDKLKEAQSGLDPRVTGMHLPRLDDQKAAEGIYKQLDAIEKMRNAVKSLQELREKVQEARSGLDPRITGMHLVDPSQIQQAQKLLDQLDKFDKQRESMREAADDIQHLLDKAKTPADVFAQRLQELNDALRIGKINQDDYNTALDEATKERNESEEKDNPAITRFGTRAGDFFVPADIVMRREHKGTEGAVKDLHATQKEALSKLASINKELTEGNHRVSSQQLQVVSI